MPGYRVIATVYGLNSSKRAKARDKILFHLRRHEGLVKRTGFLSVSADVRIEGDLLIAEVEADYASYLEQGTKNKDGTTRIKARRYIRRSVVRVLGTASLISSSTSFGKPNPK